MIIKLLVLLNSMGHYKRILTHVTFWVIHILIGLFGWDLNNYDPKHPWTFVAIVGFSHVSTFLYFYLNYSLLVPFLLLKRKYVLYTTGIVIATVLFALSKGYIWNNFQFINNFFAPHQGSGILFTLVFYYCLSTSFRMYEYWQESEKRKTILLQEVKDTELLYLKSQMSPHFLFNTLNNIYGLSLTNSQKTSLSISQLKDLLLYIETFESVSKITVEQEIHYLKSFIALNQLRYSTRVEFNIQGTQMKSVTIEPMLLLPFIENAFKHGRTSDNSTISITLSVDDTTLHFSVQNEIGLDKRKDKIGGIGIKNVKRRLELLYPQSFQLVTGITHNNEFHADLQVTTL